MSESRGNPNVLTVVQPGFEIVTPEGWRSGMVPLIERAGRICYKSEHKIEPGSAARFVERFCRDMGHESMLEHAHVTVVWTGSRAFSHQLVRHRIAAYSQESQRYCDYGKRGLAIIVPPEVPTINPGTLYYEQIPADSKLSPFQWQWRHEDGRVVAVGPVMNLDKSDIIGFYPQSNALRYKWLCDAREAYRSYLWWMDMAGFRAESARFKLANETKTEVAATFNMRTWRHIFSHRGLNPRAQWEIRQIAQALLLAFNDIWPEIFADLAAKLFQVSIETGRSWSAYMERMRERQSTLRGVHFNC